MDTIDIDQLKRSIIVALFSDDSLVNTLVLKGGNALGLAHNSKLRASFDLDFSMEGAFRPDELVDLARRIEFRLAQVFEQIGYAVFDVVLEPRPETLSQELETFWGGYSLEFKVIPRRRFDELGGNLTAIRREAIAPRPGGRARFEVDISKHEYCSGKQAIEIDHFTVYVYTPAMIVCEKIRAICQQMESYAAFVRKHRAPRARDFFDIYETVRRFKVDVMTDENRTILRHMFDAKRVPLGLLRRLDDDRDLHAQGWDAVKDTVDVAVRLRPFEFYFDFVAEQCHRLADTLST
ncbi:MAG: nucleotidyl transferase AbiEii/AbiGii toxin family protein [Phycisphaerae bacterium]|nr:nucleotidyl transferase AbiEii/AbiGii toxin family protein [Phycisphaerae bacterium]